MGISDNLKGFKDLFKSYRLLILFGILLRIDRRSSLTMKDNYIRRRLSIRTNSQ